MRLISLLLSFALCLLSAATWASENPAGLKDAITTAIKLNPKTKSTDELLESIHYSTKARKMQMFPTASAFCSADWGRTTVASEGFSATETSGSKSCGVGATVVLFDGGASYYAYKAAQEGEKAAKASYSTSDSLIPNTRGALAFETLRAYLHLVINRSSIKFTQEVLNSLIEFKKFSSEKTLLEAIKDVETELASSIDSEQILEKEFEFVVTLPAAENLEDLDSTIGSFKIPATAEAAIDIAISSGPEVIRRNSEVQMASWSLKSLKASIGPRLTGNVSYSRGTFSNYSPLNSYTNSRNTRVGLTLSIPFSPGSRYGVKSAEKELSAKQLERQAAIDSASHSISTTYHTLENAKKSYLLISKNFEDQKVLIRDIIEKINTGDTADLDITKMLSSVDTLSGRYQSLIMKQHAIISDLFTIQQVTGMLFDGTEFQLDRKKLQ